MKNFIACQACFRNFGFRKTLEEFGRTSDEPCPRCASTGTSKVDDDGLKEAMHKFFVSGSDITGTFTSRYALNKWNSSPSVFDATLAADAELACGLTGLVIFDYGPATWRVGQGCLSEEFDAGGELQHWAARDLVKGGEPIVIHADTPFFRVRVNPNWMRLSPHLLPLILHHLRSRGSRDGWMPPTIPSFMFLTILNFAFMSAGSQSLTRS